MTAIAHLESGQALDRLAAEQTALRRVAMLVCRGIPPTEIFSAVSDEVETLFGCGALLLKFVPDEPAVVVVGGSKNTDVRIGTRWGFDVAKAAAEVHRTRRPARVDAACFLGIVSNVASPILLDAGLWGAMALSSRAELSIDTEARLQAFTELVATALADAETRSQLTASRRRIVSASDEARRRIERNLHDGTQQRLVSLALAVRAAEANVPSELTAVRAELSTIADGLAHAATELQEVSRGIHPGNLSKCGLGNALRALARRSPLPVALDIAVEERLPEPIEVAAYYVTCEALANAMKHAHASQVAVSLTSNDGVVLLSISDDGIGGADAARGSGLVGLSDRVEALGGKSRVRSAPGDGTRITVALPLNVVLRQA